MSHPFPILRLCLPLVLCLGSPLQAETRQSANWDLVIRGLNVGSLSWSAIEDGASYAITGRVATSGLAAMLRKMRYDASVSGRLQGSTFQPARYEQSGGIGGKSSREVVTWTNGNPVLTERVPPRTPSDRDADPARQRGTIDTLSAIYAVMRDVPKGRECGTDVQIYDGRYRMQVRLGAARADDRGNVACTGEYIRLQGFSEKEMAERTHFPFTVQYQPLDAATSRVTRIEMDSLWGSARLVRRRN